MSPFVGRVLKRLQQPGARPLDLLQVCQVRDYERHWRKDPRLYSAFTRKLVSDGHPTRAFELAREGLAHHPGDQEVQYLIALALARGGNVSLSSDYLRNLLGSTGLSPKLKVEALSPEARLLKDRYLRAGHPAARVRLARESAHCYEHASRQPGADSFPGINAATMCLLAGHRTTARALAAGAAGQARNEMRQAGRTEPLTAPGCAFTSEQFAALLAVESDCDFVCEYVGIEPLAKEYGRCPLYHLAQK
jgi:hypothetical protein